MKTYNKTEIRQMMETVFIRADAALYEQTKQADNRADRLALFDTTDALKYARREFFKQLDGDT